MNRKQRRAKRAKERRETKPKALRRAAEAHDAAEFARVGGALRIVGGKPETLRTQIGRHVLYTRDDYTLTVVGER